MRGLLHKILREVWLGTLLFGVGLFVAEGFFAFIIPQIEEGIGSIWAQMPWVKNMMSALLGMELGDDMTTQVLMAIVWVHPVVLALVCAHEMILGTRVPAAEIDRGTIDVLLGWPVSRGSRAGRAAGKIHSDIERGFIRAEVIHWKDLIEHGSEAKCREAGLARVEGKDYIMQDGDVVHFRFNV